MNGETEPGRASCRHWAEYLLFRSLTCLVLCLSVRQSRALAGLLANLLTDWVPRRISRYDVAVENLTIAFGVERSPVQRHELIRQMWRHLFQLVVEMIQAPRRLCLETCREAIVFRDRRQCIAALSTGRPVLILSGHFGNWEVAMSSFGMFGYAMGVLARPLDNPLIHAWFKASREQTGHQLILKKGGFDDLISIVQAGGAVGVLADQDAGSRGLFVDFFGRPASTFKSIALLALEYDALICVGYAARLPEDLLPGSSASRWVRYEVGCETVIDPREITSSDPVGEITSRYTSALEQVIRRHPEQYFWIHRRWKSEPRQKKSPRAAKAA